MWQFDGRHGQGFGSEATGAIALRLWVIPTDLSHSLFPNYVRVILGKMLKAYLRAVLADRRCP